MDVEKSITEWENRKTYTEFTAEILDSIPDDKLLQAVIDYIADGIIKGRHNKTYRILKKQSIGMQYVWAIWYLEAEVNNGGFNQYFYNSAGEFAEEALNGCKAIGAPKMVEIIEGAMTTLGQEFELQKKTREAGTLEAFMESYGESQLGKWDDEFYKYPENLESLMVQYIRSNYQHFITTTGDQPKDPIQILLRYVLSHRRRHKLR